MIAFRRLDRTDFPLLRKWLAEPHVAIWWNERGDPMNLEAEYGPSIDGREAIYRYVMQFNGVPIGWIQWYRWCDFPVHATQLRADAAVAGIDLAIGNLEMTGRGIGPEAIRAFATDYIFVHPDMTAILTDPAARNTRSLGAFVKAGFSVVRTVRLVGEDFERCVVRLDR